ncbi:MAG: ABC transporter substrate-binding protein, partial [Nitrososphaera sp.]
LLSPEAQAAALEHGDQIPSNPKTKATGTAAALVKQMNEYMKTAITVDWDVINENRPAWNARWNKTVER